MQETKILTRNKQRVGSILGKTALNLIQEVNKVFNLCSRMFMTWQTSIDSWKKFSKCTSPFYCSVFRYYCDIFVLPSCEAH